MGIYKGRTVQEAIELGLNELNLTNENAVITVVDEGSKGVLGLGGKKAVVEINEKVSDSKRALNFLEGLLDILKIPTTTEIVEDGDRIVYNLITTSSASLIGYRGEMLDAIQTLTGAVANIGNDDYKRVVVNCENYREKREETLKNLALRLADKALKTGRKVSLEPMNPFERRIIHSALTGNEHITTESQGVEPNRYIVIIPDNLKPYDEKRERKGRDGGYKKDRNDKKEKSEVIKLDKKTMGYGTFLGNSLKK